MTADHCDGSGRPVKEKGRRKYASGWRYPCPQCGKYYTKDAYGNLTIHGYSLGSKKEPVAHCANCGEPLYELDYLCAKCRG